MFLQVTIAQDSLSTAMEGGLPTEETLSIMQLIVDAGWYIMIPLGILSMAAIYIFVERFFTIQKASREQPNFLNQVKDFVSEGKTDSAKSLCANNTAPIARMLEKGIVRIGKPLSDVSAAIENVGKLEIYNLERSLATLATIAGAAPMIGFLGTVIGMIRTFHEMYTSGNSVELGQLSGGIMQALVTTVAGLVIGIVAYIGYNILVAKVEKVVNKMESATIEFMDILQEPI